MALPDFTEEQVAANLLYPQCNRVKKPDIVAGYI